MAKNTTDKTQEMNRPPEGDEVLGKKPYHARGRRKWVRWVVWLMLLVPLVYVGVQVFVIMMPNVRTQIALLAEMTETIPAEGFVVFSGSQVPGSVGSGTLYYTVPAGQRVQGGGQVAAVFSGEDAAEAQYAVDRIDAEIAQLETSQKSLTEGGDMQFLLAQRQAGVYDLLDALQSHNFTGIETPKADVTMAANKLQMISGEEVSFAGWIEALQAQREAFAAKAVPVDTINAPATGYFIPSDSYDRVMMDYERAEAATPSQLQAMLQAEPEYYGSDVIGHVVDDYKWHFFTVLDVKQAEKLSLNAKVHIVFPDVSEEMLPVTVQNLTPDETGEKIKVELLCDHINPMVLQLRGEKAQIVLSTQKGVQIDKRALRFNSSGERGVYVLQPGNVASFRRIDVILEDEYYFLIPRTVTEGVNEVMQYDEVIVDAGGAEIDDGRIV